MNTTFSQAFRAQSSSKVVSIPTRYDDKRKLRVIRWKDIQLCFKDAQYIMYNGDVVLFLTDDDLEDLIPLRISHHPDVVLEVVIPGESQDMENRGDPSFMGSHNDSHAIVEYLPAIDAGREVVPVTRDVASLRIRDADNSNHALVVRSQGQPSTIAVQQLPNTSTNHHEQGTGNNVTMQEQLDDLHQQIEQMLDKMQQIDQQTQHTQQHTHDQIDKMLQTLQQMDRQHIEETQRVTLEMDLYKQQLEEVIHASQQQQQQFEVFQQELQQLNHEAQESRQELQDIRQQAQDRIDKQAQHSLKQHEQLLHQMRGMENTKRDQDRLSPDQSRQETQDAFNQFVHARYRVRSVFATPSPKLPIPRLFIILPAPRPIDDGQEESRQLRFRLYFLCECESYTMDKDCELHEVHLANHPGYDLINQDEFINKYGLYLLTMMYMVKYGVKTRDVVVPPLLGLTRTIGKRENISQLVDDVITRLQETTGFIDGGSTTHQSLDATELTELQSYLKVTDGECFTGGLSQKVIQKGHYWVCSECFELVLRQLKDNIIANGRVWKGNEARVNVTSEAITRASHYDLDKLFRTLSVKGWRSLLEINLGQDSHHSLSSPTANILGDLDNHESLFLDFGRFAVIVKGIYEVKAKDVDVSIGDLSTLTLEDLEIIQQCRPTFLAISGTPQEKDDNRLVCLLRHNLSITTLRIDCDMKRYVAVIGLVSSTREKMIQSGYRSALRAFELVHHEIKLKVSLDEGSPALDMAPCVNLGNCKSYNVEPAMYNFIRRHGWSAITFVAPRSFSDSLAKLLDEHTQEIGSRIARLDITPTSLTTPGLDAMSRAPSE
ncbi:hypothetical protein BGX34_008032 [Mortierella sp. NVP85]|nr:hypothetical protein BGX34_008032 [Mortierella sp. NVP85]